MSLTFEGQDADYWQLLIASLALTKTFDAIADAVIEKDSVFPLEIASYVEAVLVIELHCAGNI